MIGVESTERRLATAPRPAQTFVRPSKKAIQTSSRTALRFVGYADLMEFVVRIGPPRDRSRFVDFIEAGVGGGLFQNSVVSGRPPVGPALFMYCTRRLPAARGHKVVWPFERQTSWVVHYLSDSSYMRGTIEFLRSSAFGFLLKICAGMAAAAFGILGIGTTTREENGRLNRNGWTALIGIVIAGILGIGTSLYDFAGDQRKAIEEREKSERLILSVQRGLYPLTGMSGDLTISFTPRGFPAFDRYKEMLSRALPTGKSCAETRDFSCSTSYSGANAYSIFEKSRLFPKRSSVPGIVLQTLGVVVTLVKPRRGQLDPHYDSLGELRFILGDASSKEIIFNPKNDELEFTARFIIPDDRARSSRVYSLAELFPGLVAANVNIEDSLPLCVSAEELGVADCSSAILSPIKNALRIRSLYIQFPYPKALQFVGERDIECHSRERGNILVMTLPNDIDDLDTVGTIDLSKQPVTSKVNICSAFKIPEF